MTNSVVDRVAFDGSNLSGVNFTNAVITGATFKGTNLEGASFEDALIGNEDAKRLCALSRTLHGRCQHFPVAQISNVVLFCPFATSAQLTDQQGEDDSSTD